MDGAQKTARLAGALYLLSAVTAGAPLLYVSNKLIVVGNPGLTAKNILTSEPLFRASIVSELIGAILFIFMVRALYRLLNGVNKTLASLMVTLVLLSVPITFLNVLNEIAPLTLLHRASVPSVFSNVQRDALVMLFLDLHGEGVNLANIFWGLWLFPFGILVIRSGFLPSVLGVLLLINGSALEAVSITALLLPDYLDVLSRYAIIPELGELWTMAWLMVRGIKMPAQASQPPSRAS